jgi:minor extracellular serine protease Vpr
VGVAVNLTALILLPVTSAASPELESDSRVDASLRILAEASESSGSPLLETRAAGAPGLGAEPGTVQLILEGSFVPGALEAAGFEVNTAAGPVTTVTGRLEDLPRLLEVEGLRLVSAASEVRPMLDVSAPAVDACAAWGGTPPVYTGLSGRNVIVGIVDSGLDLNHADFRTSTNGTRVRYVWDQTWTGTKPPGFTYGAEYTQAQINAGSVTSFRDTDGHGTHVTGIAAGNGRATGNGQPDLKYVGIAPEADLVIVKTNFTDAGIIDGVNYVFQRAASLGRPAVVNLSIGYQKGGHDGSTALDQALTALTGPGKLVTAAAGNFGQLAIHDRVSQNAGETRNVIFTVPSYSPTTLAPENVFIEGWHDGSSTYRVKLRSPTGIESAWIETGGTSGALSTASGTITVDNDRVTNSRGAKLIQIIVYRASTTSPHPAMGNWTIVLTRTGGSNPVCDFWVSTWKLGTVTSPTFTAADMSHLITSPGTADGLITTGAYATKNAWVNGNGGTTSYGNVPLEQIADFSSPGPRRDGVQKPDVVAPGYGVAAALSSTAPTSNTYKCRDLVHYMRIGTSAANAHTTGVLALLLQQNPTLTPTTARDELVRRSRRDSYTGSVPNALYGYGKLDATAPTAGVPELVPPHVFSFAGPYPNPSSRSASFQFTLPPAAGESTGQPAVRLGIFDVQGRIVAELAPEASPGPQGVIWDGAMTNGDTAPAGVYFARLKVGTKVTEALRINRVK